MVDINYDWALEYLKEVNAGRTRSCHPYDVVFSRNTSAADYEAEKRDILRKITNEVSGVYKITNNTDNRVYIGSSGDIPVRWETHKLDLLCGRHHNFWLQADVDRLSLQNFSFEIIWRANRDSTRNEIYDMEQYYINIYNPQYNVVRQVKKVSKNYNPRDVVEKRIKADEKKWAEERAKRKPKKDAAVKKASNIVGRGKKVRCSFYNDRQYMKRNGIKAVLDIKKIKLHGERVLGLSTKEILSKISDIFGFDVS